MTERPSLLLIEDDWAIRQVLVDALGDEGYLVREAADGREALDILAAWRPDAILLDLMMPGMDGRAFRAEQRALALALEVPLLLLTAGKLGPEAAALGAMEVLAKPFDLDHLLAAVRRAIAPVVAAPGLVP